MVGSELCPCRSHEVPRWRTPRPKWFHSTSYQYPPQIFSFCKWNTFQRLFYGKILTLTCDSIHLWLFQHLQFPLWMICNENVILVSIESKKRVRKNLFGRKVRTLLKLTDIAPQFIAKHIKRIQDAHEILDISAIFYETSNTTQRFYIYFQSRIQNSANKWSKRYEYLIEVTEVCTAFELQLIRNVKLFSIYSQFVKDEACYATASAWSQTPSWWTIKHR